MLRKLHGRKLAVCLLGGAMYALFAAFGWQAEHDGHIHLGYALLTAALLVWPIAALLSVLLERGYTRSMRQEKRFRTGWAFLFILACYVPMFGVALLGLALAILQFKNLIGKQNNLTQVAQADANGKGGLSADEYED